MRKPASVIAHTLALALWANVALGAPPPVGERVRARAQFSEGERLFQASDFEGAQRAFEEAYRILPNPVVFRTIAECQIKRGDVAGAIASLEHYLADRKDAPDREAVGAQIETLRRKPGTISVSSTPPGAEVWVDGNDTSRTPGELELSPGEHTLIVRMPGYSAQERTVRVERGARQSVEVALTPEAAAVPPHPERGPVPVREPARTDQPARTVEPVVAETNSSGGGERFTPAFWASASAAGIGVVLGATFGGIALGKQSQFRDAPSEALANSGERAAHIADISFGIAALAAGAAAVIYFTSDPGAEPGTTGFLLAPSPLPGGGAVTGKVRF